MKPLTPARALGHLAGYGLLLLAALAIAPFFGAEPVPVLDTWRRLMAGSSAGPEADILLHLRLPRILLAAVAGSGLALGGASFQALLKNPLATPYTLGISSGCSLGAVICLSLPAIPLAAGPFGPLQLFSLAGGGLVMLVIYGLARSARHFSMTVLLLAGVTLGMTAGAAMMFVRYLARPNQLVAMDRWLMGALDVTGFDQLTAVLPLWGVGAALLLLQGGRLNQLALGEEAAAGRGVRVLLLQRTVFFGGSLLAAAIVSAAGPIGFVGLIVPHIVRRLSGSDHRLLLPASALAGGAFLTACDTLARTLVAPTEIPAGIITAVTGGPFFLWLLLRGRRGGLGETGG